MSEQPSEANTFQLLSEEQLAALSDTQRAAYAAMDPRDQVFAAQTFKPKDLPVFLDRKREQMALNQATRNRLAAIEARMATVSAAAAESSDKTGALAGVAAAAGLGAAAVAAGKLDDQSSWNVPDPNQAVNSVLARLAREFDAQEKTDFSYQRSGDLVHATVEVVRRSRAEQGWNAARDLIPALDITLSMNASASSLDIEVGELDKETLIDAAKALSQKGINVLKRGAWVLMRRGRVGPGEILDMAGATLDAAFDVGQAVKDLDLKKRTWAILGEVLDPLEKAYEDLMKERREQEAKARGLWDAYINCPTCGVPFMSEDVQCRVCDTARPEMPNVPDPRQQMKNSADPTAS